MQKTAGLIKKRVLELLADKTAYSVIGWKTGDFVYDITPATFKTEKDIENLVYDSFCGANLSKYLIEACEDLAAKEEAAKKAAAENGSDEEVNLGKIVVLLKPCDTYSFNQLLTEHRIDRDKIYVIGTACEGMLDIEMIRAQGINGVTKVIDEGGKLTVKTIYGDKEVDRSSVLLEKCRSCKGKDFKVYDEIIGDVDEAFEPADRFAAVEMIENMSPAERFAFWQTQLSKCIRCNACRNVCPACSCNKCVFDNPVSGVASKANATEFEDQMFHIIRAFHVAGRCTDCGECTRVCPQNIPIHLLNRKFIKDMNELYGEYQAGEVAGSRAPLVSFDFDDAEPSIVHERGNE